MYAPRKINRFWISQWTFNVIITAALVLSGLHGLWREWWVEWLLFPSALLACSIGLFELCRLFCKTHSIMWSLIIAGFSFFLLGCLVRFAYRLSAPTFIQAWQPPELPKDCPQVTFLNGNIRIEYGVSNGKLIMPNTGLFNDKDGPAFTPYITNNRVYVKTRTILERESGLLDIDDEGHKDLPIGYDKNYTSNAFEIVNRDTNPVFQLIYEQPNQIKLAGLIVTSGHFIFIDENSYSIYPISMADAVSNSVLKPIFKYPSWKYLGKYAD